MKLGAVSPSELRAISEKGLLLLGVTIPEMEVTAVLCLLSLIAFSIYVNLFHSLYRVVNHEYLAIDI